MNITPMVSGGASAGSPSAFSVSGNSQGGFGQSFQAGGVAAGPQGFMLQGQPGGAKAPDQVLTLLEQIHTSLGEQGVAGQAERESLRGSLLDQLKANPALAQALQRRLDGVSNSDEAFDRDLNELLQELAPGEAIPSEQLQTLREALGSELMTWLQQPALNRETVNNTPTTDRLSERLQVEGLAPKLTQEMVDEAELARVSSGAPLLRQHGQELLLEANQMAGWRQTAANTMPANAIAGTAPVTPPPSGYEFSALTLQGSKEQWADQMLSPLSDRVRIQSSLGIQQATIRLDPPELGKLELTVRTEGEKASILISAANPAVRDQLGQMVERLRQDILSGNFTEVNVEISYNQPSDQRERQQKEGGEEQILEQNSFDSSLAKIANDDGFDAYI